MKRLIVGVVVIVAFVFSVSVVLAETCNGDFDCDGDCDGTDAATFKTDFGRSNQENPCNPCRYIDIPRSGQAVCYDNQGNIINCEGSGQDGNLQMGFEPPNPRFTDNGDGTVKDNLTGLIWIQDIDLLGGMIWIDAVNTCIDLDFAEYQDWRLPNAKEILTLTDYSRHAPRLPAGHPFIIDSSRNWVWTNTTCPESPHRAETMSLGIGDIGSEPKTYGYKCWCVRGGH